MIVEKDNLEPGLVLNGRYRLEIIVGYSQLGNVWKARDLRENRELAVRFIPKDLLPFRNEMGHIRTISELVAVLNHPAICSFYSMEDDPKYGSYLIMGWSPGQSLENYLSEVKSSKRRISKKTALTILRSTAEALDYAHSQKIVHRDLKPGNIILKKDAAGDVVGISLINFELGAEIQENSTRVLQQHSGILKMPVYMAPEQWQSRKLDGRTDQYSLATIAYELYSGHLPFKGQTTDILRNVVLNDMPERIADADGNVNKALRKALSKIPAKRFNSCAELVDALADPQWAPPADKRKILLVGGAVALVVALAAAAAAVLIVWK